MLDREFIERVRESADIIEVVGEYVDLRKTGKSYRGLCPFHQEKTPSFYVDREKGVYHCFGCGASGNVFRFVMEMEKVDFEEAVLRLAQKFGIPIPERKTSKWERLYNLLKLAATFYREIYKSSVGRKPREYMRERGVKSDIEEIFMIGYAPPQGKVLIEKAKRRGFTKKELLDAGLVFEGDGDIFDIMRDRIIFPIKAHFGPFVGLGGRALEMSVEPKYLNSPDTKIFKKGELLYGLPLSKTHLRELGEAILVEGYMDLILMYQNGFKNVVAPLGTALTESQAKLLSKYTKRVTILFDGDEAGERATMRAIPLLVKAGIVPRIVRLSPEDDPASILENYGENVLREKLERAQDFVEYLYKKNVQTSRDTVEEREKLGEIIETISLFKDSVMAELYLKKLVEITGVSEFSLREEMKKYKKEGTKKNRGLTIKKEFVFLVYLLSNKNLREKVEVDAEDLTSELSKKLLQKFKEGNSLDDILSKEDGEMREALARTLIMLEETPISEEEVLRTFKASRIRRLIKFHQEELKRAEKEGRREDVDVHLLKIKELKELLSGERREINNGQIKN